MIYWLKLISSGLRDSLIQVSVLIFSSFFRPPWLGSFAETAECFPRLRAQYDLEQAPWTGNQAAWHSLKVSRTLSSENMKAGENVQKIAVKSGVHTENDRFFRIFEFKKAVFILPYILACVQTSLLPQEKSGEETSLNRRR